MNVINIVLMFNVSCIFVFVFVVVVLRIFVGCFILIFVMLLLNDLVCGIKIFVNNKFVGVVINDVVIK